MTTLPQLEAKCREIGNLLGDAVPPGVGFMLALFDFGEGGNLTYLSNAAREDMIKMLAEFRNKLIEGRQ
jgi:hypothetical protein